MNIEKLGGRDSESAILGYWNARDEVHLTLFIL